MSSTLGILGGMGPLATVEFMRKLVSQTPANNDQQHIPMLVRNIPQIPDRSSYLTGGGDDPFPALKLGFEELQKAGAYCIVIPCNTAHYWLPQLQALSNIHTISMIDSVVAEASTRGYKKIGILATTATMVTGLYQDKLAQYGIEAIETTEEEQTQIMDGIYAVKANNTNQGEALMRPIFESMLSHGADAVIFGCTEIPIALEKQSIEKPNQCLDSLDILSSQCISWAQQQEKMGNNRINANF